MQRGRTFALLVACVGAAYGQGRAETLTPPGAGTGGMKIESVDVLPG